MNNSTNTYFLQDVPLWSRNLIRGITRYTKLYTAENPGYNIIKLDEVDDNLDNTNRFQFSVLLNQLMDLLHYDQALVISHNDEIDLTNADMILFKVSNPAYLATLKESGANIIFSYQ